MIIGETNKMQNKEQFLAEVDETLRIYEELIGQFATRTRQMIERYGKTEALSRIVISPDLQQGFKTLRDHNKLDKTFESVVVRYSNLFNPAAVQAAQWRLDNASSLL